MFRAFVLSLLSLFAGAQASYAASQCVPVGNWVDTKSEEVIEAKKVLGKAEGAKVVLLGEDHENAEHHRWQLGMISQIYSRRQNIALGFEMFPREVQPILDDWVAGEISEDQFLSQVKWHEIWNYDSDLYMPIFHFARMNRIPMFALNIPREVVSMIGDKGWAELSPKMRESIGEPAPPTSEFKEMMQQVFMQHMPHGQAQEGEAPEIDQDKLSNFMYGQLAWDRAMAGSIKSILESDKFDSVVAIMGAGHIIPTTAVPYQLSALKTKDVLSFMPWDDTMHCEEFSQSIAHFAFGVDKKTERFAHGKSSKLRRVMLGVFLEKSEDGVLVSRVVDDSIAQSAGIEKDDIIVEIAGKKATEVEDVIRAVRKIAPGTWLPLTVKRMTKNIAMVAKFPPSPSDD
ncbi:MAG: ChaN family lipoprotein [Gammaproteobacteria bacterium]|nr:ChaN family lipoprotein [Gammaproteobacteria bacterium]